MAQTTELCSHRNILLVVQFELTALGAANKFFSSLRFSLSASLTHTAAAAALIHYPDNTRHSFHSADKLPWIQFSIGVVFYLLFLFSIGNKTLPDFKFQSASPRLPPHRTGKDVRNNFSPFQPLCKIVAYL